ncbi:MAG: replication initiation factor domain-containing protein [Oscillospiraceae bacterium]|nr:replication initiation factor domain-containing protein [Oscillospiraceae bacterium]
MSNNKIIYDWITFTSKIHSVNDIISFLGLDDVSFIPLEKGMNGYPQCLHFGGISICYGGRADMGVCCCMSGQGCRSFESYGNGDYDSLFACILENYSEDGDKRQMNLSRLDIAYDDFDGLLDILTIFQETMCNGYNVSTGKLNQGNFVSRFADYDVNIGSKGLCCYYGSKSSDVRVRIYDKRVEQNRYDLEHWVRCEIQLRGANAIGFTKLDGDICANYFGVLNNYLRFVEPSDTDSNKRRWKTAEWWDKFLESYDSVSIFARPGVEYNIMSLDRYVFGQCAGAVKTAVDILGVSKFFQQLRKSVNGRDLNPKYKDLKNQYGTSSDGILEYLSERGAL